ncbi:MAG: tyrosine-type recombinase/integrase [Devosia sp.]
MRRRARRHRIWPNSDPQVHDWHLALARLEGAYSPHTLRSYEADFRLFLRWCALTHRQPLPAVPETVAAYLADHMDRLKPNTLKRRLAGIRKIHRVHELADPTDHFEVDIALRRAKRLKPQRPAQALGITAAIRDRLLAVCGEDLIGLRDRVLVSVGFDTLCRRGELTALSVEDLEPNHFGSLAILVRRAKNDQYGTGRIAHLAKPTVLEVEHWLQATGIDRGPLVRPVYRGHAISRFMEPVAISRILKKLAARAGLEPAEVAKVSGHSLRVGAAQQLTMNGVQLLPIMRAGGWRSMNIVARYIENVDVNVWG